MKRVTGSVVYGYAHCPRAAELDLHGDRSLRRAWTAAEELVLQRGRELEERMVAPLDYVEPDYPTGDFERGAARTLQLLRDGVAGIAQGVLYVGDLLGVPDLLRKVEGASALGDHHYEVGDVKSSLRPRTQQVMQVAFYSRLLAEVQQRALAAGYLVLRDGREERFDLTTIAPVADDVVARVTKLAQGDGDRERPFLALSCRGCSWREVCAERLRGDEDLSLLHGMTRGLRRSLEQAGYARCSALARVRPDTLVKKARLKPALARRTVLAAKAWKDGRPARAADAPRQQDGVDRAVVHVIDDPFLERALAFGCGLIDGEGQAHVFVEIPADDSAAAENRAFLAALAHAPDHAQILHWGEKLPRWIDHALSRGAGEDGGALHVDLHGRLVDMGRRIGSSVAFPGPVFDRRDAVRMGLDRDPARDGDDDEAALFAYGPEAGAWLERKVRTDLSDLLSLQQKWL